MQLWPEERRSQRTPSAFPAFDVRAGRGSAPAARGADGRLLIEVTDAPLLRAEKAGPRARRCNSPLAFLYLQINCAHPFMAHVFILNPNEMFLFSALSSAACKEKVSVFHHIQLELGMLCKPQQGRLLFLFFFTPLLYLHRQVNTPFGGSRKSIRASYSTLSVAPPPAPSPAAPSACGQMEGVQHVGHPAARVWSVQRPLCCPETTA